MAGHEIEKQVGDFLSDQVPETFKEEEADDFETFEGQPDNTDEDGEEGADGADEGDGDGAGDSGSDGSDSDGQDGDGSDGGHEESSGSDDGGSDGGASSDDGSGGAVTDPQPSAELVEMRQLILEQGNQIKALTQQLSEKRDEGSSGSDSATEDFVAQFVIDDDIDDVLADASKLNALLCKVVNATVAHTTSKIHEAIPTVISGQVTQQFDVRDYVRAFYDENKDLVPVKKTVGTVANEVQAEHPDWTISQIFEETATRTRKALGLKAPVVEEPSGDGKDGQKQQKTEQGKKGSALPPGSKGRRNSGTETSGVQKQIAELI